MKILKVTIHNFRSVLDQCFELNNFSLLVGENNSGKSNIIHAIRSFYGEKFDKDKDFPKLGATDEESWIEIEFLTNKLEQDLLKDEYKRADSKLVIRRYLLKDDLKPPSTNSNAYAVDESGSLLKDQFYGAKGVFEGKLGNIVFIPSVSKLEDNLKMTGPSPFRDTVNFVMSDIVKKSPSFIALQKSFSSFKTDVKTEKNSDNVSLNDLADKINNEIRSWNEIGFDFDILDITPDVIVKNLISQKLIDNNLGKEIDSCNLGQGFQRSLIASLIKIDADIKATSKRAVPKSTKKEFSPEFTLILFEEPEAFLHYAQEEKLNADLRSLSEEPDKQVLISTHSPYFVSRNIEDISNIVKLRKVKSSSISQIKKDEVKEISDDNSELAQILSSPPEFDLESEAMRYFIWLDGERASMFFAKKILICEGATEKIFLDYLFENEWKFIDKSGLYILDALGKYNIHRFMNLFQKLEIEHFVLFDSDNPKAGSDDEKRNDFIQSKKNKFTIKIDTFDKDIEGFLGVAPPSRKNLKPLSLLFKYKRGDIEQSKIDDLKVKIIDLLGIR